METLGHDLRFAIRTLRKSPGFTAVAVLSLALGIGANSAIFSIVNATLFRLQPYPKDPHRVFLMLVMDFRKASFGSPGSLTNYLYWRDQNQVFEQLAAYRVGTFNLTGIEKPEDIAGLYVSSNFFSSMGVQAVLGRTFLPEENRAGKEHVVLLSDGLWKRRFGADPNLIGKMLRLNGEAFTVVGILPSNFPHSFDGQHPELWVPLTLRIQPSCGSLDRRNAGSFQRFFSMPTVGV